MANMKAFGTLISQRPILTSTPQESILSPALYNIYTCDFPTNDNTTVCLFADAAAILCNRSMVEEAINLTQNYILKLQIWLTKWWIAINNEKTHVIVFRKTRSHNSPPPLQIFNNTMEWTFEINCLGLIIKDNLTYRPHFEETTKKILEEVLLSKRHYQQEIKLSLKNRLFVYKQYLCPPPTLRLSNLGISRNHPH
ncbi:RNA-directed DNA polymerase from mobile element jockey [Trichonephila clavipes]|nr:RNA-directed DNA polymerase from mobile element jockey [Trichonephila clavipes]